MGLKFVQKGAEIGYQSKWYQNYKNYTIFEEKDPAVALKFTTLEIFLPKFHLSNFEWIGSTYKKVYFIKNYLNTINHDFK